MSASRRVVPQAGQLPPDNQANWQADSNGTLSGDWLDPTHWDIGVPSAATDVTIANADFASPWTVTATDVSLGSLTLDMGEGDLQVGGSFADSGALTQLSGTFSTNPSAVVSFSSIDQAGGVLALDDTTLTTNGPDALDGETVLSDGATWTASGDLSLGAGPASSLAEVAATLTLEAGPNIAVTSMLNLAGTLSLGSDPTATGAGGLGSLEVDGGSILAIAAGINLFNNSTLAIDSQSAITLGGATADAGALTIASDRQMFADIATIAGDVFSAGTFTVSDWINGDASASGTLAVGGMLESTGIVQVVNGSTLTTAGLLEIDGGSMTADEASFVQAGGGVNMSGGTLTLDGAMLNSLGADDVNADATLTDAGVWTTATLAIAPGFADGTAGSGMLSVLAGSQVTASTIVFVGVDPGIGNAVSTEPGGVATLDVEGPSLVSTDTLSVVNGSVVTLDSTASIVVGTASLEAGTVAIGSDGQMFADIATIGANLDVDGNFSITEWAGGAISEPASVLVTGGLTGDGTVDVSGTLEVGSAQLFGGTVDLQLDATLVLDTSDMERAVVQADPGGASVDVIDQPFDSSGFTPTYDATTGLLEFGNASSQSFLNVGGGLTLDDLTLASDDSTGTLVTIAPCYAAGTQVATARGAVAVEALRIGDGVRTLAGRLAPVVWIGWTRIDLARHPQPWRAAPIRIAVGALAAGVPCRDLVVSPEHALFLDGALVPAWQLANGATIARQDGFDSVVYYHVELDRHEIMMAENCPAESFLDTGNRGLFANACGVRPLHPDLAARPDPAALAVWAERGAAPLLLGGARVARLRRRLTDRARRLGWRRDADDGLALICDGRTLPARLTGSSVFATLPAAARHVRLRSRAFVPAETVPDADDRRRLGVAIGCALLGGRPLSEASFFQGWHAEADATWRWSDGDAVLALPPLAGPMELELRLATAGSYWTPPAKASAA